MYLPVRVLQVWSQGAMPGNASPNDIESNQSSWGVGANITTKLINQTGEVRHLIYRPIGAISIPNVLLPLKMSIR